MRSQSYRAMPGNRIVTVEFTPTYPVQDILRVAKFTHTTVDTWIVHDMSALIYVFEVDENRVLDVQHVCTAIGVRFSWQEQT